MSVTVSDLAGFRREGHRFAMLTCYDYPTAQALDGAGVPVLLVGDTLGIFVLGYETTLPVTMEEMLHHCRPVVRGAREALVVGDLPFGSYQASVEEGVRNAVRLVKEGGVAMVKLEGPHPALVSALVASGIPVMAHLGLTPQAFHALGGNKVQARTLEAVQLLVDQARALEQAGASALVLEAVPSEAARQVTAALAIPTIGIGAGPHCDGQVLVGTELLGLSAGRSPRFVKRYADVRGEITAAAKAFVAEVAEGEYPDHEHSYDWALR